MKNKSVLIFLLLYCIFFVNFSLSEEFQFESSEIIILEKGNLIKATGDVKATLLDGTEIQGEESIYYKDKSILKVKDNVIVDDKINKIKINAENVIYYKKKEIIKASGNIIIDDKANNIKINTEQATYDRKNEIIKVSDNVFIDDKAGNIKINAEEILYNIKEGIISSKGKTFADVKNQYKIESSDLFHNRNQMKIYSDKRTIIEDSLGNIFEMEAFKFDINKKLLNVKKIVLFDNKNNKFFLENSLVDLKNNKIVGKDIRIDFDNSIFGNKKNEPRLKGRSISANSKESSVYKGVFTTCRKNNNKCPPWAIYAGEVKHNKIEKRITYKNAWLKIYDKPIIYFPYFFHPDPTVNRQSGFLPPSFINSSIHGTSIQVPYYKVISIDKDVTITPRIFFDNNLLLQSEYRQSLKNSDAIIDLSININNNNTKSHFFSNISGSKENGNFEINLEKVSNDNYLKVNKIKSPLIDNTSTLNSFLSYDVSGEDYSFDASIEVYEDLTKKSSDRFEYIFPSFIFEKDLNIKNNEKGNLKFSTTGIQKKYDTNIYELSVINDLDYSSNPIIFSNGLKNDYNFLLRNVNATSKNSKVYNNDNYELLTAFLFKSSYPLSKQTKNYNNYFTPIFSARYSPNKTKNKNDLDRRLSFDNIFSLDRIAQNDMVEGGQSITLGFEYSKKDLKDKDYFNFGLANNLRDEKNYDLPTKTSLGEKRSDIVGNLDFFPSKYFDIEFEFSLDKNLEHSNYNFLQTNLNINNFVTSFEFLEEDNNIGNKSYLINRSQLKLNENNSLIFNTSKNLDKNITNYYNLIYEYKNDCLTAALEYNKEYYIDSDLKPEENLFFSIKIPFGQINTPSIKK